MEQSIVGIPSSYSKSTKLGVSFKGEGTVKNYVIHKELHSAASIDLPIIPSTSLSINFSCGTEYSLLEGMASLRSPKIMNECLVPWYGPSNPNFLSRPMKSRRFKGFHILFARYGDQPVDRLS
jgi:hypothetical protein